MSSKPSIFISYRREDSEDVAGRIYDRLKDRFGAGAMFFDVDTIPLGIDFEEYIDSSVSQCQVFLAIIGRAWLMVTDDEGVPRLESETDFVRLEIESALNRKIPVVPLLVSRAKMPKKSELPASIRQLVSRNGVQIRSGKDFHKDIDKLIKGIEVLLAGLVSLPASSFPESPPESVSVSSSSIPLSSLSPKPASILSPMSPQVCLQGFGFEVITVDSRGQEKEPSQESAEHFLEDLGNGVTLDMVRIPGGEFLMGSPEDESQRQEGEGPQHLVAVPEFFIGRYPVTQAQWRAVAVMPQVTRKLNPDPSNFKGDNRPVEQITWNDAAEFCSRLTKLTGRPYRLPTEAEWEYACRAGSTTPFHFGESITTSLANYRGTNRAIAIVNKISPGSYGKGPHGKFRKQTTDIGSFGVANIFGLYDMHGNVWEWCRDTWHETYTGSPIDGSAWINKYETVTHVLRGGSWNSSPGECRSAARFRDSSPYWGSLIGLRVVCVVART